MEHSLNEVNEISVPTFIQHSGKGSSKNDYILVDNDLVTEGALYKTMAIFSNFSPHLPLVFSIPCKISKTKQKITKDPLGKSKWNKADLNLYRESLAQLLDIAVPIVSTEAASKHLINSMQLAADIAVPHLHHKKKKAPWNGTIKDLLSKSNFAHMEWKMAGRPPLPHPLASRQNTLKHEFRQAQRLEIAIVCTMIY